MLRSVLFICIGLLCLASAQNVVKYMSEFANKDPNVDDRYTSMIKKTEEVHRQQYETAVESRVSKAQLRQAKIEKLIAEAKTKTRHLQLKQRLINKKIRAMLRNTEVSISREKLAALRLRFDRTAERIRRSLMMEEGLDNKYHDQHRILKRMERQEKERRKLQFEEYKKRLEAEAEEERTRLLKAQQQKEKDAEDLHKRLEEENKKRDAQILAQREAEQRAALEEAQARQQAIEKESKRQLGLVHDAALEGQRLEEESSKDLGRVDQEYALEEERLTRLLKEAKLYTEKAKTEALEDKAKNEAEEESKRSDTEQRLAKQMLDQANAAEKMSSAKAAAGGAPTLLQVTATAQTHTKCDGDESSSGDGKDGLNEKGECQIGPKIEPTANELYPVVPELKKKDEKFYEHFLEDTRGPQMPAFPAQLSLEFVDLKHAETMVQTAHNQHLTFTEQNVKTCKSPICERGKSPYKGYP